MSLIRVHQTTWPSLGSFIIFSLPSIRAHDSLNSLNYAWITLIIIWKISNNPFTIWIIDVAIGNLTFFQIFVQFEVTIIWITSTLRVSSQFCSFFQYQDRDLHPLNSDKRITTSNYHELRDRLISANYQRSDRLNRLFDSRFLHGASLNVKTFPQFSSFTRKRTFAVTKIPYKSFSRRGCVQFSYWISHRVGVRQGPRVLRKKVPDRSRRTLVSVFQWIRPDPGFSTDLFNRNL